MNGEPVDEAYLHAGDAPSSVDFDIVVPEGSCGSWAITAPDPATPATTSVTPGGGTVPVDRVVGRADLITWPVSRWRTFERPRSFDRIPAAAGPHG